MEPIEQALHQAVRLAKNKHYTEARQFLRVIIQHYPAEDRPWYLLAVVAGSRRERIAYLKQCLRLNPANELAAKKLKELSETGPALRAEVHHQPVQPEPTAVTVEKATVLQSVAPFTVPPEELLALPEKTPHPASVKPTQASWAWVAAAAASGLLLAIVVYLFFGQSLIERFMAPANSVSGSISLQMTGTATPQIENSATAQPTQTEIPTSTVTPYPTATASLTPTFTATPTETATPFPTHTPTPDLPASAGIGNIYGSDQRRPLSCEASAAVDWANYFGVSIAEMDFQNGLPISDNPEKGFVGSVDGVWGVLPPRGYGVHAEPVAALLRAYGLPAQAVRNYTYEELQRQIANGNPVIIWFVGQSWTNVSAQIYIAEDGSEVLVAPYEHVVLLVGYGPDYVTILDGSKIYYKGTDTFLKSWGVLQNMAIIYEDVQ